MTLKRCKKFQVIAGVTLLMASFLSGCVQEERKIISQKNELVFETIASEVRDDFSDRFQEKSKNSLSSGRVREIKINAVGDIMIHRTQLIKADRGDYFDFSPSFEYIKPLLSEVDYTFANLETTLAGELGQRRFNVDKFYKGYSGFPCFNTPDVMAEVIKNAGFDFVSTANNHSFDSDTSGVLRTLDILEQNALEHTGTFRNQEAAEKLKVVEVEGITFGVINYTYGLNGFRLKEEESYLINNLEMYSDEKLDQLYAQVKAAENQVDFVVVMLHYGNEYVINPDQYYQRPIVDALFTSGADIILGGHPHVLQPLETREIIRANGQSETGVVIYSLGNFLSSQRSLNTHGDDTDIGAIFEVTIYQVDHHKPYIGEIAFTPTFIHWSQDGLRVIPTEDAPEDLTYSNYDHKQIQRANNFMTKHMQSYLETSMTFDGRYYRLSLGEY